jgi:hypothetical protein
MHLGVRYSTNSFFFPPPPFGRVERKSNCETLYAIHGTGGIDNTNFPCAISYPHRCVFCYDVCVCVCFLFVGLSWEGFR